MLDDERDRAELRDRYYGLLQELRVVVTGVQVLLAFLLTVPFAQRFAELDSSARAWFGVALASAMVSALLFLTPTALHRFGKRTARSYRLEVSIIVTRLGLLFLGVAMLVSFAVVVGFLFSTATAGAMVAFVAAVMVGLWVLVPLISWRLDRGSLTPAGIRSPDGILFDTISMPSRGAGAAGASPRSTRRARSPRHGRTFALTDRSPRRKPARTGYRPTLTTPSRTRLHLAEWWCR